MKKTRFACILLILVLSGWGMQSLFSQQDTPNPNMWCPNESVKAIACSEEVTYIGGYFTYVGRPIGNGVPVNSLTGVPVPNFPTVQGIVYAAVSDLQGGWYIGGSFTTVGGITCSNIAHILVNFSVDPNFTPDVSGTVFTLTLNGSTLYAGGQLVSVNGQPRKWIAAIDTSTGQPTNWAPQLNNESRAIIIQENTVYIGGLFTSINGQLRNCLGAVDVQTGAVTPWNPNVIGNHNDTQVFTLAYSNNIIYVGGRFNTVGSRTRLSIAAIDISTGNPTPWNPNITHTKGRGAVSRLLLKGNIVYVGGYFTHIGGLSRNFLAAINKSSGVPTSWDPNLDNSVSTMVLKKNLLYVGGSFRSISGQNRPFIAAIDTTSTQPISFAFKPGHTVCALAMSGTNLYVGGVFCTTGDAKRNYLAALDNTTGQPTAWNPNPSNEVNALLVSKNILYVGGKFKMSIGGKNRSYLAAFNTTTGQLTDWNPMVDGEVRAICKSGNTVYVGGIFNSVGGQSRGSIAAVDASTGQVTTWNPNTNNTVNAIAVVGNTVYIGGHFYFSGDSQGPRYLAGVDANTGQKVNWIPNTDTQVYALTASGNDLYVGGLFNTIGGQNRKGIAKIDHHAQQISPWDPRLTNIWVVIQAMALNNKTLFIGGVFNKVGEKSRSSVAAVDTLTAKPRPWNPILNNGVLALAVYGSMVCVGGSFWVVDHDSRFGFARFDGFISTYEISGTVTDGIHPLPGVTIIFSHDGNTTTTDANGQYFYRVTHGTTTTITPSLTGYCFRTPPSRILTNITEDQSEQNFQGVPATLILTSPNGGEVWGYNMVRNITWNASCLTGNVQILLWKDKRQVGTIAYKVPAQAGSYEWPVGMLPAGTIPPGNGYIVKIETVDKHYSDSSDSGFSIVKAKLSVMSPAAGENWELGRNHNITWTSLGFEGDVELRLTRLGKIVGTIARRIPVENGNYLWKAGEYAKGIVPAGSGYRISVYGDNKYYLGTSEKTFTITSTNSIYINHNCLEIEKIPVEWLEQARKRIRFYLAGEKLPMELMKGLEWLGYQNKNWAIFGGYGNTTGVMGDIRYVFFDPCLIYASSIVLEELVQKSEIKVGLWDVVTEFDLNVLMFLWNRETEEAGQIDADAYLWKLSEWEERFGGNIRIVYSTVSGEKGRAERERVNEKIRYQCLNSNRVLFDLADIESWYKQDEYTENNAQTLHPVYTQGETGYKERCIRQARAFWWLMARLAGWQEQEN